MIQFNLLPDVKIEYIRAKRIKRTVILVAIIAIATCTAVLGILSGAVYGLQRNHISNLTEDIERDTRTIQEMDQINRVLTVQNQLNTIVGLHDDKPVVSRVFGFIETVTPSNVSISRIESSFEQSTLRITGQADSLATVNIFVDTLEFTNYELSDTDDINDIDEELPLAFSNVVLSSFGVSSSDETTYAIELSFDPLIFDNAQDVELVIRERITTRSEVERPQALFAAPEEENDNGQN